MNALTPLVIQNAEVLRRIAAGQAHSKAALAAALGRDQSAFGKTIKLLTSEGFVEWPRLTPAGVTALAVLDGQVPAAEPAEANPVRADAEGVPHGRIFPDPNQPRKKFSAEDIAELSVSIRERGLLQRLLVRPMTEDLATALGVEVEGNFVLTAGERRWRAIGVLIDQDYWAADFPVPADVRPMTEAEVALAALVENMQRQDMTYLEEAHAFQRLHIELGMPTQEIADKVGKTQRFVQQRLQLLELSADEKTQLDAGTLSIRDARQRLANRPDPLNLIPAELVVVAELIAAANPDVKANYWTKAEVDPKADTYPLFALLRTGLIKVTGPAHNDGRFYAEVGDFAMFDRIAAEHPDLIPADRKSAVLAARARLAGSDAAEQAEADGVNLCGFLNGPFSLTAEGEAVVDLRETEARQRASDLARAQAAAQLHADRLATACARVDTPAKLAELVFSQGHKAETVIDVLSVAGARLPWRYVEPTPGRGSGKLVDADGHTIDLNQDWGDAAKGLRLKLIMAAVNAAAELEPVIDTPDADPAPGVLFRCETCGDEFESEPADPTCSTCNTAAVAITPDPGADEEPATVRDMTTGELVTDSERDEPLFEDEDA